MAEKRGSNIEKIYRCMNCRKRVVTKPGDHSLGGKDCEECKGPLSFVGPISEAAYYIRREIIEQNRNECFGLEPIHVQTVVELYFEYLKKNNKESLSTLTINVDVSNAITGLKAVTREAKNAAVALKELEQKQSKVFKSLGIEGW